MRAVLLAGMVLAACATRDGPPAVPDTPDAAACRIESRDNPERRLLMQRRFTDNARQVDAAIEDAQARAFRACMRRRGAIEGDGVERVRRR